MCTVDTPIDILQLYPCITTEHMAMFGGFMEAGMNLL